MNLLKHRFASGKADGADATQVQPSAWNDGHSFSGGAVGDVLTRDPTDANYGAKWVTPPALGTWQNEPYNAANFYAIAPMVWTVTAGQVLTNRYMVIGKTLTWTIAIAGGVVSGTPAGYVYLTLPGGLLAANQGAGSVAQMVDGSSASLVAFAFWAATANRLSVQTSSGAAVAGGGLTIRFTVTLEIP